MLELEILLGNIFLQSLESQAIAGKLQTLVTLYSLFVTLEVNFKTVLQPLEFDSMGVLGMNHFFFQSPDAVLQSILLHLFS